MKIITRLNAAVTRDFVAIAAPLLLAGCGSCRAVHGFPGHCAPPPGPAPTYNILGYVAGLTGSGLTLSYNSQTPLAITRNGAIAFDTGVPMGTKYSVAIVDQPTNPSQTCIVSNPTGAVGFFNVSVLVYCPQAVGAWLFVATTGSITTTPGVASVPGSLSTYAIDASSGALTLVSGSTVPTGPAVATVQLVPHSPYLWALSMGDASATDNNTVSSLYAYTADANSGLLTTNPGNPLFTLNGTSATPAACNGIGGPGSTSAITFAPSGAFGYDLLGANPAQNHGTYIMTSASGVPLLGQAVSNDCDTPTIVDPSGQYAYYGRSEANGVHSLVPNTVNSTGALAEIGGYEPPNSVPTGPGPPEIDPFGRFIYSIDGDSIDAYQIIPATNPPPGYSQGSINSVTPGASPQLAGGVAGGVGPFAAPPEAISIVFSPDGQFAYVAASGGLYAYSIGLDAYSTGEFGQFSPVGSGQPIALQIAAGQTLAAPGITTEMAIDPSGQFLYVSASVGSGQQGIYVYKRDATTGMLTLVPGSPFAVTSQSVPLQLAIY